MNSGKNKRNLFKSNLGALLEAGDHIPNVFQDNISNKIKHVLIEQDSTLNSSNTKFGRVKFLQVNYYFNLAITLKDFNLKI